MEWQMEHNAKTFLVLLLGSYCVGDSLSRARLSERHSDNDLQPFANLPLPPPPRPPTATI
jgi:hypothetical protein